MKRISFLFALIFLFAAGRNVQAYNEDAVHDCVVGFFKEIEAIFSWHVEDRKTLKEVSEETAQGILS